MGAPKIEEITTYKINEVEIFSAGKWNNDDYTVEDLHEIVKAFSELHDGFRPYLKLGHDESQRLAKSSGLPSVGWVERVYVRGDKLLADFDYVPKEIYSLIKSRAYRKVSCEIYWNLDVNGTKYSRVLGAVALLGAENPGVMNLADILGKYSFENKYCGGVFEAIEKQDSFKQYSITFESEDDNMEELEKVKAELETLKKDYAAKADVETQKAELEKSLEEKKAQSEKDQEELKAYRLQAETALKEAATAKLEKFALELETQKLMSPSMKGLVTELMSDKKEYSVSDKKYSKEELVTEILKLSKENAKVNFDESSKAEFSKEDDKIKLADDEIKKYQDEHKCTYGQAYKAVMKSKNIEETEE